MRASVLARRANLKARAAARRAGAELPAEVPGLWAVTWFEALARSGRVEKTVPVVRAKYILNRSEAVPPRTVWNYEREEEEVVEEGRPAKQYRSTLTSSDCCPACGAASKARAEGARLAKGGWDAEAGVCTAPVRFKNGTSGARKVCGHVEATASRKAAYAVLGNVFRTVCVDEGTMIKGDDSLTSKAVRAIRARYRMLATGTPIKNFVVDLFWLLWWALRDSSARFPYAYANGKERFEKDFAVIETEMEDRKKKGRPRIRPEVTNVPRLWKMLGSSVVRRRMDDVGVVVSEEGDWTCRACAKAHRADVHGPGGRWLKPKHLKCEGCGVVADAIVPLRFVVMRMPMGIAQQKANAFWLSKENFAKHFQAKYPDHPMSRCNNSKAIIQMNAASLGQLPKLRYAAIDPLGDPDMDVRPEGLSSWTPTRLEVLEQAERSVREGKRVVIGSSLVSVGPWLAARLQERGIRAAHITETDSDGKARTLSPKKRASAIAEFRAGKLDVLCVSAQAVALGHNLDCASVFIGYGLPWDFAGWDQLIKRVRRLSSPEPVTVYVFLPEGSLEEDVWAQLGDKGAAADLALDGHVVARRESTMDQAALLRAMQERGVVVTGREWEEHQVQARWEARATA